MKHNNYYVVCQEDCPGSDSKHIEHNRLRLTSPLPYCRRFLAVSPPGRAAQAKHLKEAEIYPAARPPCIAGYSTDAQNSGWFDRTDTKAATTTIIRITRISSSIATTTITMATLNLAFPAIIT